LNWIDVALSVQTQHNLVNNEGKTDFSEYGPLQNQNQLEMGTNLGLEK